jgi:beta-glucanase (GH16 family)
MRKAMAAILAFLPFLPLACGNDGGLPPQPTSTPSAVPTPGPPSSGPLVFSDEFDYEGPPDSAKWDYEKGAVRNNEAQSYTSRLENARVGNGILLIEGRREAWGGKDYTSASVITKRKAAFLYGRIEVRAKLPTGRGTWPAIWLLGTNIDSVGWPTCGEIDVMENVGFEPLRIYGTVHTRDYNHTKNTGKGSSVVIAPPWEDFHVYSIDWVEDRVDFFVDGAKYFSFANEGRGVGTWPYDHEHYLLLNLALGGSWGGQQGIDDSLFPHRFEIDYVRVYGRK